MSEGILGNATGGFGFPKTYILTDENGNELTGVYVESETIFTATDNDVREGMVYAADSGVSTGTKVIPTYYTRQGVKIINVGKDLEIPSLDDYYDYTKLQAIVCLYNSSLSNSVAAEKVVIDDKVYVVQTTDELSSVTKDDTTKNVQFGIVNNATVPVVIRYFTYKEIE